MTAAFKVCRGRYPALLVSFLVAVTVLGGCALSRPAPIKHTFLLEPPVAAAGARVHPSALRVGTINVAAPFRGRALIYRLTELKYDADFYSEFLVAPAAMIGEITARSLDRSGVFARVIPPGAPPDGDWVLDGFVSALYGDVRDPAKPKAELAISFFLSRADAASSTPLWSRNYERRVAVPDATPEAYARALSGALGEILADLARDLAAADLGRK
jgi:cholesterol transport system auxiliary component